MKKPNILFFDYGDYRVEIQFDGKVDIISLHKRNYGNKLSQWFTRNGYLRTKINSKTKTIHSIVCEVYYGQRPAGMVINHRDGNKLNNHPDNLEYCTQAENIKHAINHGLHICVDPRNMPTYKDGRTSNKAGYKKQWYLENRDRLKSEGKCGWNYTKKGGMK